MKLSRHHLPGLCLTLCLAVLALIIGPSIPWLGAETLAMLAGIILGNTFFTHPHYESGVKWGEKYPIEIGIALMGLTVNFSAIKTLNWNGLGFIIIQMVVTILVILGLGRHLFKTTPRATLLMGAGNAVCGSSAIAAVAPAIGATDNQRRTVVATVSLTGMVLLLILPLLAPPLLHHNLLIGALVGGTVQSVGQVVGTASLINGHVVTYATLFKMIRIMMLTFVVLIFSRLAPTSKTAAHQQRVLIPWFIYVFVLLLVVNSLLKLPLILTQTAKWLATFCGIINLAGIGLNLKFATIKESGPKFISFGLLTGCCQVVIALILIHLMF